MVINEILENTDVTPHTKRQQLFLRYTYLVLIDLVVLNLFSQYWDLVYIEFFSISLLAAILLQVLLQAAMAIEQPVSAYFKKKSGTGAKVLRGISIWAITFVAKLIILEAINLFFGGSVVFGGPIEGLVSFLVVIITMIIIEQISFKVYRSLGNR